MYATIRRYSTKTAATADTVDQFVRRIESNFLPRIHDIPGFHSYGVMRTSDTEILSNTVFEDREGSTEATRRAAEFVKNDPFTEQLNKPEVIEGDLLLLKEAGMGVR